MIEGSKINCKYIENCFECKAPEGVNPPKALNPFNNTRLCGRAINIYNNRSIAPDRENTKSCLPSANQSEDITL